MKLIRLIFGILLISIINTSCQDDNEVTPDYAGKWLTEKTIAVSAGFTKINYTLEIKDNHFVETFFEDVYQYKYPNPVKFVSIEGSVSVSGNLMKFTPSKFSFANFEVRTSVLSEPYETHLKGEQNFETIFNSLDLPSCKYEVEFSVNADVLSLKADKNGDGSYTGFDETISYAKQSILEVKMPPL